MDATIEKYFDPKEPGSYAGASTFQKHHKNIKFKDLAKVLSGYRSYTMHKPVRQRFKRRRIYAPTIDYLWELDLADVAKYRKANDNYTFLFCAIDVLSKKAWVVPILSKSSKHMVDAFKKVLQMTDRRPKYVRSDKGTEYMNKAMQALFKAYNIIHYTSKNDDVKCAVAERFIRTIKSKIQRYMVHHRTERFVDVLDLLTDSYNQTYHRTIGISPNEVNKNNEITIRKRIYGTENTFKHNFKFQKGDHVRIVMKRDTFQKSYEGQWSEEIFIISKQIPNNPVVYKIKDLNNEEIDGTFYEKELQKVVMNDDVFSVEKVIKTRRRNGKTQYFVKWLGYNDSFNSWTDSIL